MYNKRRMRWLPGLAIIILTTVAVILSSFQQVPTVDVKWGTPEEMNKAQVYYQDGIKNIKCYGSSMSLVNQIRDVPGILGVQTFVSNNAVKVFFNPDKINSEKIKELLFNPVKELFRLPSENTTNIGILNTGIDRFFDAKDEFLLSELLKKEAGILAFETSFGEPVHATIFFDKSLTTKEKIISLIESNSVTYKCEEELFTEETGFGVINADEATIPLSREDFIKDLFTPYVKTFNDYEKCDTLALVIYEIPFPQCLFSENTSMIPLLRNHIMFDNTGIVKFETTLDKGNPVLRLFYIKGKTTPEEIFLSLNKEKLTIHYKDGTVKEEVNPFSFPDQGKSL